MTAYSVTAHGLLALRRMPSAWRPVVRHEGRRDLSSSIKRARASKVELESRKAALFEFVAEIRPCAI
jgi:hypothetical protein